MNCRLPILLLPLALVSACNDNPENDRRTASGQVLEGTINDNMLPLDTVQSQPPLMKAAPKKGADAKATGSADASDSSEQTVATEATPAGASASSGGE